MHLTLTIPGGFADGATRRDQWDFETVAQVGGGDVRNQLWTTPLRFYEIPFATCKSDDPDFIALKELWKATEGGLHSFNLFDDEDGEDVRVRFDGELQTTAVTGPWVRIETIQLREVRD